jgi:hypothetical protein
MANSGTIITRQTIDELLQSRFGGARNIRGVRFQLLYSLWRAFDLYGDPPISEIRFEGLEDVDLKGLIVGNLHIQVKSSQSAQGWSWLKRKRIFDHFVEVHLIDRQARFAIVTNFDFQGQLKDLQRFCSGQMTQLPPSLRNKLSDVARRGGLNQSALIQFLRNISFERVSEQELLDRLQTALIRNFDLNAGNESLYLSRLLECTITWAAARATIQKRDLETEKLRVEDWIGLGIANPAVHDRLIQPLTFVDEQSTGDYYEGKKARPGHILAALDAPRPKWQQEIEDKLKRVRVCIIKASSGQGKSTLLYRYAFDHFVPDAVYKLRACAKEEHVGSIVDYLHNRLILGLPLLVLIDNLSYSTRLWHEVAAELAGNDIRFLVTAREEDWYRYGLGMSGFLWDFVEPSLSLDEAQDIFRYFRQRNRVATNVPSAGWAYEHVADKRLLIEFVYLITHGQMLAERIEEQIKTIVEQKEDPAKLEVVCNSNKIGTRR